MSQSLFAEPELALDPVARELIPILLAPTARSSAGYPYLHRPAFLRLRDWVPHILEEGPRVLSAVDRICARAESLMPQGIEGLHDAARVVRQVVHTAAITAPPNLWLLRHVLSSLKELGVLERLVSGETIGLDNCAPLLPEELRIDLNFLLSRGYLVRSGVGVRMAEHRTAQRVLAQVECLPSARPASLCDRWKAAFTAKDLKPETLGLLIDIVDRLPLRPMREAGRWTANLEDIEIGYRLVPVVLGLWASGRSASLLAEGLDEGLSLCPASPELGASVTALLRSAGIVDERGGFSSVGHRLFERGVGALGIIEAYHAYMEALPQVLKKGRGSVHVQRGTNITASQEANRKTFRAANDALDRFCADTGFQYPTYIEHAIGKGEASRQRFARSGDSDLRYFGADLEDAAIDAAMAEQAAGHLPEGMQFVRRADIGQSEVLVRAIREAGASTEGAVMVVGNGFHEIRGQSDQLMVEVFASYEKAGLLLLFTEESALSVDDLLETAWNTYHPAFRYVHERSGQGLRPALPGPPSTHGRPLPASWTEIAERAGYVRAARYCSRSRSIFPYPTSNGHNPSISHNHFFVPARIADELGLGGEEN